MIAYSYAGFEWDSGNSSKNWRSHRVSKRECEEIFDSEPLVLFDDRRHSQIEKRMIALGTTKKGRKISVAFTYRGDKIRVISARAMSKKERKFYGEEA